jgi:aminoglycoside phosphotransferase family enzyme/predicted kinase
MWSPSRIGRSSICSGLTEGSVSPPPPDELLAQGRALIERLRRADPWPHPVQEPIGLMETPISWVLLTGSYAYKLPKPVDLGFLDCKRLEQRRHHCREELRLNRRLCTDLYLDLAVVLGPAVRPQVQPAGRSVVGKGKPLAWAVRMRQFPQEALLPAALERGAVEVGQLDALALTLARFHADAAVAPASGPFGSPDAVRQPVRDNFASLQPRIPSHLSGRLERLRQWSEHQFSSLRPLFQQRLESGRVRECHGDLHLGNLLLEGGRIVVFDCLAFSETLRWIDVISDIAFLVMDLEQRQHSAMANQLLNRWLEHSGDYDGLALWRWYISYRALVRAKVEALAGERCDPAALASYLSVAERQAAPPSPSLLICHGLSGSGKSHHAMGLARALGAIVIRSDVERKRWFGLWGCPPRACRQGDPYAPAVSEELYLQRLPALAGPLLAQGFSVIVDATFLQRRQRLVMAALADRLGVPFHLLELRTPLPLLRRRIRQRARVGGDPSDADLAVLERQRQQLQPLDSSERARTIAITADATPASIISAMRSSRA